MDGLTLAATVWEVAKLARAGLTAENPYRSVMKTLTARFPGYRSELLASFDAFLQDEDVATTLATAISDKRASQVVDQLTDRFVELSTIPNLTHESASNIVLTFASHVRSELLDPTSSTGLIHQVVRDEGAKTRAVIRQEFERSKLSTLPGKNSLSVPASLSSVGDSPVRAKVESGRWKSRLKDGKQLFDSGNIVAAHALYVQILKDAICSPTDENTLYRLHYNIGGCLTGLSDYDEAIRSFKRALRIRPEDHNASAMLAQALLLRGDRSAALSRARKVIKVNPHHEVGWLVLARVAEEVREIADLPEALRDNPHVLLSLADRQLADGRITCASTTTKTACRVVGNDVQCLVMAAQLLLHICTPMFGDTMSTDDEELIASLLDDSLATIAKQNQSPYHAQALACRAGLRFRQRDVEGGTEDARIAYELSPQSPDATMAYVYSLALAGDFVRALHHLDRLDDLTLGATGYALKAQLLADSGGSDEEVEKCIARSVLKGGQTLPIVIKIGLADVATRRRLRETSRSLVDDINNVVPRFIVELMEARIQRNAGDSEQASHHYGRSLAMAPTVVRQDIGFEYAAVMRVAGRYDEMVAIVDDVGLEDAPDGVLQVYCEALTGLGQWDRVARLLDTVGNEGRVTPEWLLHLRAVVATRSDDFPKAIKLLRELAARCSRERLSEVELQLAYALWQHAERDEAVALATKLAGSSETPPVIQAEVAKLLSWAGDHDRAIRLAYVAMRATTPKSDYDPLYVAIFLRSPENIDTKNTPSQVGTDTWVSLKADDGETIELWLLSEAFECTTHHEIRSDSDEARWVLGRSIGDTVQIRPMDVVPTTYHVTEISTIWTQAYRETLAKSVTRASTTDSSIQSLPVGDVESVEGFTPLIRVLERQRKHAVALEEAYQSGKLPLSVLSTVQGISYLDVYNHAITLPKGLLVEGGSVESIARSQKAAKMGRSVVLDVSSLLTLEEIDMLHLPNKMFGHVIVPVSLRRELEADVERTMLDLRRGEATRVGLSESSLVTTTVPEEVLRQRVAKLRRLIQWVQDHCQQVPRAATTLAADREQIRCVIGASSHDTYALADKDTPLYADDLALRLLAQGEQGAATFSTYWLIVAGMEAGAIQAVDGWHAVIKLIDLNHHFIPVSAELVYQCLVAEGHHLGSRSTKVLERLVNSSVETGAAVFASLIRRLSTSVVGSGTIVAVVRYVLAALEGLDPHGRQAMVRYRAAVRRALQLHPLAWDAVNAQFKVYL